MCVCVYVQMETCGSETTRIESVECDEYTSSAKYSIYFFCCAGACGGGGESVTADGAGSAA